MSFPLVTAMGKQKRGIYTIIKMVSFRRTKNVFHERKTTKEHVCWKKLNCFCFIRFWQTEIKEVTRNTNALKHDSDDKLHGEWLIRQLSSLRHLPCCVASQAQKPASFPERTGPWGRRGDQSSRGQWERGSGISLSIAKCTLCHRGSESPIVALRCCWTICKSGSLAFVQRNMAEIHCHQIRSN